MKYLALLRGINVGGNNIIKKDELKTCFTKIGCQSVLTYIQSGNILFQSEQKDRNKLITQIKSALKKRLNNDIPVVIFSEEEYQQAVSSAPKNWGLPEQKANALFLIEEIPPAEIKKILPELNNNKEQIKIHPRVIFWWIDKEYYAKSTYTSDLIKSPLYKKVTIRNSNTTHKLLSLFDQI